MGDFWHQMDVDAALRLPAAAYDAGVNPFDNAEVLRRWQGGNYHGALRSKGRAGHATADIVSAKQCLGRQ